MFPFPYFNVIQSIVFDDVLYSDTGLVVSAPTGSGKTAVFELAIMKLLSNLQLDTPANFKIIYSEYFYIFYFKTPIDLFGNFCQMTDILAHFCKKGVSLLRLC